MKKQRSSMRDSVRRGFTLVELLTVMAIMALMMSIAGVSFFKARQGAEMRGATRAVQTTISLARQQAVVKRTRTKLTFANMNGSGYMILETVRGGGSLINAAHATNYLPPKITFANNAALLFETDGSAGSGTTNITLNQLTQQGTLSTNLTFNCLIGAMVE